LKLIHGSGTGIEQRGGVLLVSDDEVEVLLDNLEKSLNPYQALDLDRSELGMVAGPFYDNDDDVWKITVNVRHQGSVDADLDVEYTFEGLEGGDVLDDIYPEFVQQLEERYSEMQLEYTDPEI
jgi:hypothetical protein